MLHKLSLDANRMAISYWQAWDSVPTNIFSLVTEYCQTTSTCVCDVWFSYSMALPMKKDSLCSTRFS